MGLMFTGIIEQMGAITALRPRPDAVEIQIQPEHMMANTQLGDSIAVDGICLTVTAFDEATFTAFVSAETLRKTSLGAKQVGHRVNLEEPLTMQKKLSGHMVQGHVDGVGRVEEIRPEGDSQMWRFSLPLELAKYLVAKGSVAVDGISLTVVDAVRDHFTVAIIPKTVDVTTFQDRKPGDSVNIETDVIGKYVYKYMHPEEA
jgi:riboflavin synthase